MQKLTRTYPHVCVNSYKLIKTLGRGTFGKVKLAENMDTGELVAMKIIDKHEVRAQNLGPQVKREISIMKQLKHPNCVQVKEVLASSSKIFIIMEYVKHGELREVLDSRGLLFIDDSAKTYSLICTPCCFNQVVHSVRMRHGDTFGKWYRVCGMFTLRASATVT